MIDFDRMIPFSIAIVTVLLMSRFNRSLSFNRSFLNFVNELGSITPSSGAVGHAIFADQFFIDKCKIYQVVDLTQKIVFGNDQVI